MALIKHMKYWDRYSGSSESTDVSIHSISQLRIKQYCKTVFDLIRTDSYKHEVAFPKSEYIDDIIGGHTLYLPQHCCEATCLVYTNKTFIDNRLFYCNREMLSFLTSCAHILPSTILVTGDSDFNLGIEDVRHITASRHIAQNLLIAHPNYIPLPVGIRSRSLELEQILFNFYNQYVAKTQSVYAKFSLNTHSSRPQIHSVCKDLKYNTDDDKYIIEPEYIKRLKQHFFVVSPESAGVDSARTWEALYCQTIPIVKRSIVTEFYSKIFPMIVLDDWGALASYKFDHNLYYETMSKYPNYTKYLDCRELMKYIMEKINVN